MQGEEQCMFIFFCIIILHERIYFTYYNITYVTIKIKIEDLTNFISSGKYNGLDIQTVKPIPRLEDTRSSLVSEKKTKWIKIGSATGSASSSVRIEHTVSFAESAESEWRARYWKAIVRADRRTDARGRRAREAASGGSSWRYALGERVVQLLVLHTERRNAGSAVA